MRYLIESVTQLQFDDPISEHQCELRLSPYVSEYQVVEDVTLETDPQSLPQGFVDCFGNQVQHFGIVQPHERLEVRCISRVRTSLENPFDYELLPPQREDAWVSDALRAKPRLWGYILHRSSATPGWDHLDFKGLELPSRDTRQPLQTSALEAMDWVQSNFDYDPDANHVHSSLQEVLDKRAGGCQDFAHLLITVVRAWGIPARFAMGYIDPNYFEEETPNAAHAWAEILMPGAGWRGFDPSHGLLANDAYILIAVGRDDADVTPLRGSFKGGKTSDKSQVELSIVRESG